MSFDNLELRVLKTIISTKKHGLDFANENDPKLFSSELWNFANIVTGYIKTHKDLPTLRVINEKLSKGNNDNLLKKINIVWEQLQTIQVDDKEYKHDLDKLKKRFAEKQLLDTSNLLSKLEPGSIDISKTVTELQKTIQSIRNLNHNKTYESRDIKDFLPTFVDKFNAKRNNPNLDKGLLTKYSFFDYATNGLKPSDFVVIAGETGFGKSLFLNNIAAQVWLQNNQILFDVVNQNDIQSLAKAISEGYSPGKNIIYFSLEMPYEDCFNRLISRLAGVPTRNIENAKLSKEEFHRIKLCLDFIKEYPHQFKIVDIADACADDLESILLNTGENFDAIFIDYLGIMRPNEKTEEQDWLKQGIIAYEIRAIARKYGIPVLSAVQLNRKSTGKESSENIGLARLARSATIATHVTHVVQIENRPNEEKYPDFIYHFIKNRKGPKGKGVLIKDLSCARLLDKNDEVSDLTYDDFFKDQDDISEEIEKLEL